MTIEPDLACNFADGLLTDYLEDVLAEGDRTQYELHIVFCPDCLNHLANMRTVVDLLGALEGPSLTGDRKRDLLGRS